ncbi:hypothetical protein AB205_0207250 [Aquarana catesbeiana]|uniref:Uncharacterized protein n=1 Tax=Aquarana catesbeiana TaxID=8400 RepID=A0A2G9SFS5_AQUCT|nr:hypothetical protein AB205_0207250 [Aquarana catesbeiana]
MVFALRKMEHCFKKVQTGFHRALNSIVAGLDHRPHNCLPPNHSFCVAVVRLVCTLRHPYVSGPSVII